MIQRKGRRDEYSATYNCASDQGTLENTRGEFLVLCKPKCDWLNAMEAYVDRWLTHFVREAKVAQNVKPVQGVAASSVS